ncbi:MAG: haloacid dehalogenase-like hydrolase [Ignavibacteriaceae bacterium]
MEQLNWSVRNFSILNKFLTDYGTGGKYFDPENPHYAVIDWDNTCIFFDCQDALFRYQAENLLYKVSMEEFLSLLKNEINGKTCLPEDYGRIRLSDINADLADSYNFIFENYSGPDRKMSLEEIKKTYRYKEFFVKLLFLYNGYCRTKGIGSKYAYTWILRFLSGFTIEEVKVIAGAAIDNELSKTLSIKTIASLPNISSASGQVNYSFLSGMRVIPEMQWLLKSMQSRGIDVFIVSASYKPVIELFSGNGTYGFNVPAEKVIAMEMEKNAGGQILPENKKGSHITYGMGKVEAIREKVKNVYGIFRDPVFSAGDSDGDYEMSTAFPGMKLTLLWNRRQRGLTGELCRLAVCETACTDPRFILQGRDEKRGIVIPFSESIMLGETEMRL